MAKLSNHQILDLAYKVGWRKAGDLERVLAIVLAESGGNTEAENRCCVGLMQINVLVHKQYTRAEMKQAEPNMRAGFLLWQQSGWAPWKDSRGGQLLRGPEARASTATWHASPGVGEEGTAGAVGSIPGVSGIGEAVDAANRVTQWITTPANIGRIVMVLLGGIIIVGGVLILARPAAQEAIRTAVKVAK